MLIDSHCHLDFPDFAEDGIGTILDRARAAGVQKCMTISTHIGRFDSIRAIAEAHSDVYCTVGTHPHQASEAGERDVPSSEIIRLSAHPKVIAIGECGLDYHYDFATKEDQHAVFSRHIQAGVETNLPLVIHSREAEEDTIRLIKESGSGRSRGVMHCFTGSAWLAQQALELGYYISFSGVLTFKKSDDLRAVAADVPLDRLLVETDSPYLAPMPFRGKRNEPAYVAHTAAVLAGVKGVSVEDIARITTENFYKLFDKAVR